MKNILAIIIIFFFLKAGAQEKCATDIYHKANKGKVDNQLHENLKRVSRLRNSRTELDGVVVVPVVVHVIHSSKNNIIGENGNISDEQIISQIQVLNEDYRRKEGTNGYNNNPVGADVQIEFCLATTSPDCLPTNGITRHYSSKRSFDPLSDIETGIVKAFSDWPNTSYLNIWVCSLTGGYLGYSQFPNYTNLEGIDNYNGTPEGDGMLISHKVFGRKTGTASSGIYNLGRTVTHEIGHWLGLKHTWGDDYCGNDYCDDTPSCSGYFLEQKCRDVYSTCVDGITTRNMIENYLDYSPDVCMNIFTNDQKARMRSVFVNSPDRVQILSSNGCQSNNIVDLSLILDFENQSMAADQWTSTQSANTSWQYFSNGAFGSSLSSLRTVNNATNSGEMNLMSISPYVNLDGIDEPVMKFDIAYPNLEQTDSLVISAYAGCNSKSILIKSYKGKELITSDNTDPAFLPQKKDWKTFYISLKDFEYLKYVKIQFENHSKGGGNIYLDNIKLYKSSKDFSSKLSGNLVLLQSKSAYNENSSGLKVEVAFAGTSDVFFEIFNLAGNKVVSRSFPNSVPGDFLIDNLNLANGLYLVKTSVNGQVSVSKAVVMTR